MDKKSKPDDDALELKRDVSRERIGRDVAETGQVKQVVKREFEFDGVLGSETIIEYAQLYCGHLSPASAGGLCVCGRSYCRACLESAGANCSVCGRLIGPCCVSRSCLDQDRVYCKQCRFFGWLAWLFGG
ncbi:MAG: hypothetical protein ABII79_05625 [bacterium]